MEVFEDQGSALVNADEVLEKKKNRKLRGRMIFGVLLPFLLFPVLSIMFLVGHHSLQDRLSISPFVVWAELGLTYLYARNVEKQNFILWADRRYNLSFYLLSIIGLYGLCVAASLIAEILPRLGWPDHLDLIRKLRQLMQGYPVLLVFTCITAAVTEELIFRAYTISRLSIVFKSKFWPVFISAVIFCVMHLSYGSIRETVFTLLFGLIFGFHYQRYRNIKVLMFLHFVVDLLAFNYDKLK
jgi:membrane protease YdiL (CAAX protease family)